MPELTSHASSDAVRAACQALLLVHGQESLSAQAVHVPELRFWQPDAEAFVPYRAGLIYWVALGPPVAAAGRVETVLRAFVAAARAAGKQAIFFGIGSDLAARAALAWLACGEDPICERRAWLGGSRAAGRRSLGRQVRRARRTVRVEAIDPAAAESAGRQILRSWRARQAMPALHFAAAPSLRTRTSGARHWLALAGETPVGVAVALPNAQAGTWLIEQVLRRHDAPNGTAELLIATALEQLPTADRVSLGFVALAGRVAWPLQVARQLARGLYSFEGLATFRRRLAPSRWQALGIAYPKSTPAWSALLAVGIAFIGGRPLLFAARFVVRGPGVLLWAQSLALLPWTLALALLPQEPWFVHQSTQQAWVAFDLLLAILLALLAWRPSRQRATALATIVSLDLLLTSIEACFCPPATTARGWLLRAATLAAPALSATVLWGTARRLAARDSP